MLRLREQRGATRLAAKLPTLGTVIAGLEAMKGEKWEQFRQRHGEWGCELVLYLGPEALRVDDLAQAAGPREYASVAMAVKRYEARLRRDQTEERG